MPHTEAQLIAEISAHIKEQHDWHEELPTNWIGIDLLHDALHDAYYW